MFKSLRFKLIKFIIGKYSVVANVNIYGKALVGDGIAHNSLFTHGEPDRALVGASHCDRLISLKHTNVAETDCAFVSRQFFMNKNGDDANDGLTFKTAKLTLNGIEKIVQKGDIVWVGSKDGPPPLLSGEIVTSGGLMD